MSTPTAAEALERITAYVRYRRENASVDPDPETVHAVFPDPEKGLAEMTISDLETLVDLFSTAPTDVQLRTWGSDEVYLASGSSVRFHLAPDDRDRQIIDVYTTSDCKLELYSNRSLSLEPRLSNIVRVQVRP